MTTGAHIEPHTVYESKKVANGIVELWVIVILVWVFFGGKSRYCLAGSRCHSCENPKTRRYCALGTTYIFAYTYTPCVPCVYIHTYAHIYTLAYRCHQFYYSNALTEINQWPTARDLIRRKWSLYLSLAIHVILHVLLIPNNPSTRRVISMINLGWAEIRLSVYPRFWIPCFPFPPPPLPPF